jgi:small subunit ribosomal protein S21
MTVTNDSNETSLNPASSDMLNNSVRGSGSRSLSNDDPAASGDNNTGSSFTGRVGASGTSGLGSSSFGSASKDGVKEKLGAMEVVVDHNIEKAIKVLKRKMIKEGTFRELKSRRYYEKPSDKKKRKEKESVKKVRKEKARSKKNQGLLF